jgi:arylsulfatase A
VTLAGISTARDEAESRANPMKQILRRSLALLLLATHGPTIAQGVPGKWQLGTDADLPKTFGFDEFCLWQHMRAGPGNKISRYLDPGLEINGVIKDYAKHEYGPDLVSDYALDFIQRMKDRPVFLYYTMMLTHAPFQTTPDSPGYGKKGGGKAPARADGVDPEFADMVAYTDQLTGKLVATLDELGLRDNTLIILVGDNGTQRGTVTLMGERRVIGGKGQPTDAGMHVPLIVNWPARAAAGNVYRDLVDTTDFLPTICEAAGVPVPAELQIDGRSFLPQVRGEKGNPRDRYCSWQGAQKDQGITAEFAATRDFKLSRTGAFYDLRTDIEEKNPLQVADLTGEAAATAKVLQGVLDQYKDARPAAIAMPFTGPSVKGDGRGGGRRKNAGKTGNVR